MFRGAFTALVTPFKNGRVDYAALESLIESQITRGIDGLVPCGTTGESPTLSEPEHDEVIHFTVKAVKKRVPVIAGTGSNSTEEAIRYTRHALDVGADAALLACPYYNKPSQRGLVAHFNAVAAAAPMPLVLYNIPGRTGINMAPETIAELSKNPRFVGVKEASGNLEQMIKIRALCAPEFDLISGDDTLTLPILAVGGTAVISVTSHLLPGETSRIVHAYLEGKTGESKDLFFKTFGLVKAVMGADVNPVGVKTALALRGEIAEEFRLPLVPASPEAKDSIRQALDQAGLLATAGRR
ncbi:MAG TPA: 4-hydroxy-tetrahydrodipicolinate synthase [bacterium]|nr:4-hydroxy-tetrahydrodipicolinate synthase [bacterium]